MNRVIKLSTMELNTTQASVVKYLKEYKKPVLVEAPVSINVWATFETKSTSDKGLNRNRSYRSRYSGAENELTDIDQICDTKLIKHVDFIELPDTDVSVLSKHGHCKVKESCVIHRFDSDGELKKLDWLTTKKEYADSKNESQSYKLDISHRLALLCVSGGFIFLDRSVSSWEKDNSVLNEARSLDVNLDSIYVFEEDIQHLIKDSLDSIPKGSPYYIGKDLRNISDLDKLAEIGFKYFGRNDKRDVKQKDLAEDIMKTLGFKQRKADSAAFFLSPNPVGKKGGSEGIALGCQFPYLTHTLKHYWLDTSRPPRKVSDDVISFLEGDGFSSDNAKYGELLSRKNLGGVKISAL